VIPADCCSTNGGATQIQPAGGWNDARVSVYFGEQASFTSRTPTRFIPTPTVSPTPPPPPPPTPAPSHTGAIVGGVIGGVAFLFFVFLLIWYCMRRRRTQANQVPAAQSEKYSVSTPGPPSTVGSPSLPGQQEYFRQLLPVEMPPPQTGYPYYHPGYGPPPMGYYPSYQFHPQPAYPPVDNRPPDVARVTSHEMPTVKSPDVPDIIKPMPVRSEGEVSQE